MRQKFSSMAFMLAAPIAEAVCSQDFFIDLAKGLLLPEEFVFFLQQDNLLRIDCAKALSMTGARLSGDKDSAFIMQLAHQTLTTDRELHRGYFKEYRAAPAEEKNYACFAATSHLLERAALGSPVESLAALLPWFWLQHDIGVRMGKHAVEGNPYARWVEAWSARECGAALTAVADLVDRLSEDVGEDQRAVLFAAFVNASRLAYCFFEDASQMRSWPV